MVEVFLPEGNEAHVRQTLEGQPALGIWHERLGDNQLMVKVLLKTEDTEAVLDALKPFAGEDGFHAVLLPVEAALPRPNAPPADGAVPQAQSPASDTTSKKKRRISREELYADVAQAVELTPNFVVMVALSAIVASIGLLKNSVAVVIGAMVIAPLLGPNVALALATTLADGALSRRALKANLVGVAVSFVLALGIGFFFATFQQAVRIDQIPEVLARTRVDLGDIALALASGVAGALTLTSGMPTTLIGVMVAVALLPPLAAFAILLGAGQRVPALQALLLLVTNVICINLAGVVTFLLQGIRPATWWEAKRAKRASLISLLLWVMLLAGLIFIILFSQQSVRLGGYSDAV